ncbi:MAG TPA: hypothetical protein VFU99_06975 [Gaiellaceae bacterium]|nr:hypothetical protein [Gaiellaceae bacterium]
MIRFDSESDHDRFERAEVLRYFGGDSLEFVRSGMAMPRTRKPTGDSGTGDARSVMIPEIDGE